MLMCNKAWLKAQLWVVSCSSSRWEHGELPEGTKTRHYSSKGTKVCPDVSCNKTEQIQVSITLM